MMTVNHGSKRTVIGAHYGLRDWLVQRFTGVVMALFTLAVLIQVLLPGEPMGYHRWSGIFGQQWMKLLAYAVVVALAWHAWVGMRNIWMDYVRHVGARLTLQVLTLVWLTGCAGWALQVLWRL
jgi:succinate dehydrogenase / fumarate reductase membrane anchor subunit